MRAPTPLLLLISLSIPVLLAAGCKKNEPQADATQELEESFQSAEPEVRQAIVSVNANLESKNYVEAARALTPVVQNRPLTGAQKQAIGVALQQLNQAIATDPSLDTKEMHELRLRMFRAVDSGPEF